MKKLYRCFMLMAVIFAVMINVGCTKPEQAASAAETEAEEKSHAEDTIDSQLTLLPDANSKERLESITHIVLHFTSNALEDPESPYSYEDMREVFIEYGLSAHYLIDREGQIYNLVPENRVAFHAGKGELAAYPDYKDRLNDYSIGIELMAIGTREEMKQMLPDETYDRIQDKDIGYTEEQYESLRLLLDNIYVRYPSIPMDRDHIIGHDEYAPERKSDPGSLFDWSEIGF